MFSSPATKFMQTAKDGNKEITTEHWRIYYPAEKLLTSISISRRNNQSKVSEGIDSVADIMISNSGKIQIAFNRADSQKAKQINADLANNEKYVCKLYPVNTQDKLALQLTAVESSTKSTNVRFFEHINRVLHDTSLLSKLYSKEDVEELVKLLDAARLEVTDATPKVQPPQSKTQPSSSTQNDVAQQVVSSSPPSTEITEGKWTISYEASAICYYKNKTVSSPADIKISLQKKQNISVIVINLYNLSRSKAIEAQQQRNVVTGLECAAMIFDSEGKSTSTLELSIWSATKAKSITSSAFYPLVEVVLSKTEFFSILYPDENISNILRILWKKLCGSRYPSANKRASQIAPAPKTASEIAPAGTTTPFVLTSLTMPNKDSNKSKRDSNGENGDDKRQRLDNRSSTTTTTTTQTLTAQPQPLVQTQISNDTVSRSEFDAVVMHCHNLDAQNLELTKKVAELENRLIQFMNRSEGVISSLEVLNGGLTHETNHSNSPGMSKKN